MRHSKYWDNFQQRADETVHCLKYGNGVPIRRVAVFITERCNFRCKYCNVCFSPKTMTRECFGQIIDDYAEHAIIHITGGEPSVVPWLYPMLRVLPDRYKIHLNTNAYHTPPAEHVKRLKVSLDGYDNTWDELVGKPGAFKRVANNIKEACIKTVVSLTYTLSKRTMYQAIPFVNYCNKEFPDLYAIFFSVYKGEDPEFVMTDEQVAWWYDQILPHVKYRLNEESRALLEETQNEKRRLLQGVRFEQNSTTPCYLSMSERVIGPDGSMGYCSHLYRDGLHPAEPVKCEQCKYGCNQRLVEFNNYVEAQLNE